MQHQLQDAVLQRCNVALYLMAMFLQCHTVHILCHTSCITWFRCNHLYMRKDHDVIKCEFFWFERIVHWCLYKHTEAVNSAPIESVAVSCGIALMCRNNHIADVSLVISCIFVRFSVPCHSIDKLYAC